MKTCTKCKITQPLSRYRFRKDTNKYTTICKQCDKKKCAEYYKNNRNKVLVRVKSYSESNKTKIKDYKKEYRKENHKFIDSQNKIYIEKNIENYREYQTRYQRDRRARKFKASDGTVTKESLELLLKEQDNRCYHCGEELTKKKHLDHYFPLARGGKHSMSNVIWSCARCNQTKSAKIPTTLLLM